MSLGMAGLGDRLMPASPQGPVQDLLQGVHHGQHRLAEQAADLWQGQRDQPVTRRLDRAAGRCARGSRRGRHTPPGPE